MDQFIKPDDIVLLLDHYSLEGRNLRISFEKAGYRCPTVVVEDDGFLPDDVLSVYGFFLGNFAGEKAFRAGRNILTRLWCRITGRSAGTIPWDRSAI